MAIQITETFPLFHDLEGDPLAAGRVFIGKPNLDAEAHPKEVFFDAAMTIAASQPIRTNAGRLVNGSGQLARIYTDGDFSIIAKDAGSVTVFSAESGQTENDSAITSLTAIAGDIVTGTGFDSVADLLASTVTYGANTITHNGESVTLTVSVGDIHEVKGVGALRVLTTAANMFTESAAGYVLVNAGGIKYGLNGQNLSTQMLGATADGSYRPVGAAFAGNFPWLKATDSWDWFALETMIRKPASFPMDCTAQAGTFVIYRPLGAALISGGGKSHMANLIGVPKATTIKAHVDGEWPTGSKVMDLKDNGPTLSRRTMKFLQFDGNGVTQCFDTSYTASSGPLARHNFEGIGIVNYIGTGWTGHNNDESLLHDCFAASNVGECPLHSENAGGPVYISKLDIAPGSGRPRISAQNIICSQCSFMDGFEFAQNGLNLFAFSGQLGQSDCTYSDGTVVPCNIFIPLGVGARLISVEEGTYVLAQKKSASGFIIGGEGNINGAIAAKFQGVHLVTPDPFADNPNSKIIGPDVNTLTPAGKGVILLDGCNLEDITIEDTADFVIEMHNLQSIRGAGLNYPRLRRVIRTNTDGQGVRISSPNMANALDLFSGVDLSNLPAGQFLGSDTSQNMIYGARTHSFYAGNGGVLVETMRVKADGDVEITKNGGALVLKGTGGAPSRLTVSGGSLYLDGVLIGP